MVLDTVEIDIKLVLNDYTILSLLDFGQIGYFFFIF